MAITDTNALIIIAPITHFLSFYIFKERPFHEKERPFVLLGSSHRSQLKKPNSTPAATAEPITPATFGPMACINR